MASERAEEYLLAILELSYYTDRITSRDVARKMGVTQPTVVAMFKRMDEEDLVRYRKYEGVRLLRKGRNTAHAAQLRKEILIRFFTSLGLSEKTAARCADSVKGGVPPECILRIDELTAFLGQEEIERLWKERIKRSF